MYQHRRSPLSQTTVRCSPEASWVFVLDGGLGFSTQLLWGLVPDADISGDSWDRLPFLSMTQQLANEFHPPTFGQVDTIMNMYHPLPGYYPTLSSSDETLVTNEHQRPLWSLPEVFPEPQTQIEVPDDNFAMQVDSVAEKALSFDTHTSQSHDPMTNESRAITDVVASHSLGDLVCFMTKETQIPSMQFGAKPFSDEISYSSPTSSTTSGASRVRRMHEEPNRASRTRTYGEGEYLVLASSTKPCRESCMAHDRSLRVKKMVKKLYRCGCGVSFSQRQALTRHSKDKHSPKKRCHFCAKFTWSQGRHYIYRKHLQEEHPGVV